MALTPAQLQTYKTDIFANTDPAVVQALANGDAGAVTNWYNQQASPDYHIYRDMVTSDEIRDSINAKNIADITSADRGRCVDLLAIRAERGFKGSDADDRAAWADIFSAATGSESQQAIAALWARLARNLEKVFSLGTGTGADSSNADTTSFQGTVSSSDTSAAINLP